MKTLQLKGGHQIITQRNWYEFFDFPINHLPIMGLRESLVVKIHDTGLWVLYHRPDFLAMMPRSLVGWQASDNGIFALFSHWQKAGFPGCVSPIGSREVSKVGLVVVDALCCFAPPTVSEQPLWRRLEWPWGWRAKQLQLLRPSGLATIYCIHF